MNRETLQIVQTWLNDYVKSFADENGSIDFLIQLKIDHSLRVAEDCNYIASKLDWPEDDINLSEAVGLLHDAGRFSQFKEYGTFHDAVSVDHGERGFDVVSSSDALTSCTDEEKQVICDSIRYHNRRELPPDVSGKNLMFLKLIRDADKVDIIHIVNTAISEGQHDKYPQIMMNIDMDGPASPELVEQIKKNRTGTYENVHSLIDINLMRASWVYTLNYRPTYRLIADRNLLDGLIGTLPDDEDLAEITSDAARYLADQLKDE